MEEKNLMIKKAHLGIGERKFSSFTVNVKVMLNNGVLTS